MKSARIGKMMVPHEITIERRRGSSQSQATNLGANKKESGVTNAKRSILVTVVFATNTIFWHMFLPSAQLKENFASTVDMKNTKWISAKRLIKQPYGSNQQTPSANLPNHRKKGQGRD